MDSVNVSVTKIYILLITLTSIAKYMLLKIFYGAFFCCAPLLTFQRKFWKVLTQNS